MNSEHLSHLLEHPELISDTDVYSLEQLCKQFPYFSAPHILLAFARHKRRDYRASDSLHAAALRLSKRPWLRAFIENQQATPRIETPIPEHTQIKEATTIIPEQEHAVMETPVPEPEITETIHTPNPQEERPRLQIHESPPAYSIEQYFSEPDEKPLESDAPKDFYSWLRNPKAHDAPPPVSLNVAAKSDDLIQKFLQTNPSISRPKKEFFNPVNVARKSEEMDDTLVTETLAHIYWKQKNLKAALQAFERLMLKFPEKNPYFAGLIQKISNEIKQS